MPTVRLTLEYDGTEFHGWAVQPGLRTVEGELRAALDEVYPEWSGLAVAGRTDAGVHAVAQVASFAAEGGPPPDRAAQALVGHHDFTTFRSVSCQAESPVKTLDRLEVVPDGQEVRIEAAARSFLHHQVRSMVGCLALVGRGQWKPADISKALEARDRAELGFNAPAEGLYFVEALYP